MLLLTRDEGRELLRRAQAGDLAARGELVVRNRPYVLRVVRRLNLLVEADREDARQVGCIGLMEAIERFDLSREGVRFMSYAAWRVTHEIQEWLRRRALVHVPAYQTEPSRVEAARRDQIGTEYRAHAEQALQPVLSLAVLAGPDGGRDPLEDGKAEQPPAALERAEELEALRAAMGRLEERDRAILEMRSGARGDDDSLKGIGEAPCLTRERVRQCENAALRRLARTLGADEARVGSISHPGKPACDMMARAIDRRRELDRRAYAARKGVAR